ncbi:oxygenase MpaB family protein [Streptomyces sp. NPDC050418]|uniref:oxygenase MpaB family protein n=1 Tax=Streptomyces sp. NPDC050418 TaxID=3365612 RepID=UPI003794D9E9
MTWPSRRGDAAEIALKFPGRAEQWGRALRTGDPLADAVFAELATRGRDARRALLDGLRGGLGSLDSPPPAVAALLADAESVTSPYDIDRGAYVALTVPPFAHNIALGQGALINTYTAPAIATVLTATGRLTTMAGRRLDETGKWLLQAMLPGGLERGADGYTATVMVRVLHARMRAAALERGWDEEAWGTPIGQADLVRTWLDFTLTSYRALAVMGYDFTDDELTDVYRRWQHQGRLLGIDPALLDGLTGHEEAAKLADLIALTDEPATADTLALVRALQDAAVEQLAPFFGGPDLTASLIRAFARLIQGDERADTLAVPPSELTPLLPVLTLGAAESRRLARQLPDEWAALQHNHRAAIDEILAAPDTPTAYESNLT